METTSSNSNDGFNASEMREYVIPYSLLIRSLTGRMFLRLRRCEELIARARAASENDALFAWLAAMSVEWTLVENLLKLYATIGRHSDIRSEAALRDLNRDFQRELPEDERVDFHKRLWMLTVLDQVPDSALKNADIEPEAARRILSDLTERSLAYLTTAEFNLRGFYRKYSDMMNAHKHGRALFAIEPIVTPDGSIPDSGNLSLNATRKAVTAFIAADGPMFGPPRRLLTVTADAEYISDMERTFDFLAVQVPRLAEFFDAWSRATLEYLRFIENDPTARRPVIPFFFFGEPYSQEEEQFLKLLGSGKLVF